MQLDGLIGGQISKQFFEVIQAKEYVIPFGEIESKKILQYKTLFGSKAVHPEHHAHGLLKIDSKSSNKQRSTSIGKKPKTPEKLTNQGSNRNLKTIAFTKKKSIHEKKGMKIPKVDQCCYMISTFNEIGIREPFPLELTKKQLKQEIVTRKDQMVYNEQRYKQKGFSLKYGPTNELLFKMIRAC